MGRPPADTARPERQRRELGTVARVAFILGGLAVVAHIGLILAIALPRIRYTCSAPGASRKPERGRGNAALFATSRGRA